MYRLEEISKFIEGELSGDNELLILNPNKIEDANENEISFLANPKYTKFLSTTKAGALIIANNQALNDYKGSIIRVENVYTALTKLLSLFEQKKINKQGEETPVFKGEGVEIGEQVYLGAFTYLGKNAKIGNEVKIFPQVFIGEDTEIGNGTIIFAGVKIYANTKIGSNCIIHSGAIIGSDGFGFAAQNDGTYNKIAQLGKVIIENDVEIGANTTIDCGTMGATIVRNGVKIDNQVQVGHNVEIGENTVIAAQTGISGSTKLGNNCVIGGQVGFVGHINIAPFTQINAKSGVSKSILENGQKINGSPAFGFTESYRAYAVYKKLPEIAQRIKDLEEFISLHKNNG
jgi:UDP-3-O-[3-hydroxymyristoyl] glucosamine N-acyltransferase